MQHSNSLYPPAMSTCIDVENGSSPRPPSIALVRIPARLSRLILATLLLAAVSCGESTAPKSMNVAISVVNVGGPDVSTYQDTLPLVTCYVDLSATATGTDTASWQDAIVRWYAGTDRSAPLDSLPVHIADVRLTWGNRDIGAGQTQTSHWQVEATVPFHAEFEYRYLPAHSGLKTASAGFDCGPKISTSTPPPTIDSIGLPGDPAGLLPGDSLTVDYTVSSSVGILETGVQLTGPCTAETTIPAQLQTRLTGSARVGLPADCPVGVPVTVTVLATDAGIQTASRAFAKQIPMVDATPPTLLTAFYPPWGGTSSLTPYAIYFDGDSVATRVSASDNHALSAVVWDVLPAGAGIRDSILVSGRSAAQELRIRLQPGTTGPVQFRIFARDSVGLASDTLTTTAGAVQVYPKADLPTMYGTVTGPARDALVDPRHGLVFVRIPIDDRMVALSLPTMTETWSTSWSPEDFDITPGGDSLILALGGSGLGIVDLRQSPLTVSILPLTPVDSTGVAGARFVRTLSNGKVFVTLDGSFLLDEVDLATGVQRVRRDAGDNGYTNAAALGRSLDHSVVVLNGSGNYFQRYDVSTDTFGPRSQSAVPGAIPVLDSTGQHVVVGVTIYDGSLQFLRQAADPLPAGEFFPTALSADGGTLYEVMTYPKIVRCRVSDGAIVDAIPIPVSTYDSWARISDDGTLLITTEGGGVGQNGVSVTRLH